MKTLKTKTTRIAMLLLVTLISISSCKKDSETTSDASAKVKGKWTIVSYTTNMSLPGMPKETVTIDGLADDYMEFASDGKVTMVMLGQKMVSVYQVESGLKITFSGQSGTITTLNDKALVFNIKLVVSGVSSEQIYTLKK